LAVGHAEREIVGNPVVGAAPMWAILYEGTRVAGMASTGADAETSVSIDIHYLYGRFQMNQMARSNNLFMIQRLEAASAK